MANDLFSRPGTNIPDLFDPLSQGIAAPDAVPAVQPIQVRAPSVVTPRPLTKSEQKAIADANRANQISQARNAIISMQQSPEWVNASLARRNKLYNQWRAKRWQPAIASIEDADLAAQLQELPAQILGADIRNLEQSIKDSSRLGDTWKGTKAAALQVKQGFTEQAPAVNTQRKITELRDKRNQDADWSTNASAQGEWDTGHEAPAEVDPEIAALIEKRNKQMDASQATQKQIDELRRSQSIGQTDRERELEEDIKESGEVLGTLKNATPANVLQTIAESTPSLAGALAITAAGTVGGAPGAVAGSVVGGSLFGAQGAMTTAIEQVMKMPDADLQKSEEYRQLLAGGATPQRAKEELALNAGLTAAGLGGVVGAVTGGLGGGGATGAARLLTNRIAAVAGPKAAQQLTATAASLLPGIGLDIATNAVDGAGSQLASNYAQQEATGVDTDLAKGVGRASVQSVSAGIPFTVGSAIHANRANQSGSTPSADAVTEGNTIEGQTATESAEPVVARGVDDTGTSYVPNAADAYNQEVTGESFNQEAPTSNTAQSSAQSTSQTGAAQGATQAAPDVVNVLNSLRPMFDDVRSRSEAFSSDEAKTFIQALFNAEAAGVPYEVLRNATSSIKRAMPEAAGADSITTAYDTLRTERNQASIDDVSRDLTAKVEDGTEPTNGDSPSVNDINSAMERASTPSADTASTVSENLAATGASTEESRAGGESRDGSPQVAGNEETAVSMGSDTVSGADNRAGGAEPASQRTESVTGERSEPNQTGQRAADAGSAEAAGDGPQGRNFNVGDEVVYSSPYSKPLRGIIEDINDDGTIDLRVNSGADSTVYRNLTDYNLTAPFTPQDVGAFVTPAGRDFASLYSGVRTVAGSGVAGSVALADRLTRALNSRDYVEVDAVADAIADAGFDGFARSASEQPAPAMDADAVAADIIDTGAESTTAPESHAEELASTGNEVADAGGDYSHAAYTVAEEVGKGNTAKAEEIAGMMYENGRQDFKSPNTSTGAARTSINDAYSRLSEAEQQTLQAEYASIADGLPPDVRTFEAFRDNAIQEVLQGDSQPSLLSRLSDAARSIVAKISAGIAAVVMAISLATMTPVTDAIAAGGGATVAKVVYKKELSTAANTVNSWVQASKDNAGRSYLIADKRAGTIHVVNAKGDIVHTAPALYGRLVGDGMKLGETPAGVFTLHHESAPAAYGGDLQQFASAPGGDVYAVHRVLTGGKQQRVARLKNADVAARRISLGCINVPEDVYNKYLAKSFNGKMYVLPDSGKLGEVFKGIDEQAAQLDLTPDATLPVDINEPTAPEFKSSTINTAPTDIKTSKGKMTMETGAAVVGAASASADPSLSSSFVAVGGTGAAGAGLAFAAMLPFFGLGRNQRRAKAGRKGSSPDEGYSPDVARPEVADKDYHSVDAVLGDRNKSVSATPAHASSYLANVSSSVARKLSDTQHDFIQWVANSGLVSPDGEFDAHASVYALKTQNNRIQSRTEELATRLMNPVFEHIVQVGERLGLSPDRVGLELGSWQTFKHIPEANAALRKNLETDYFNAALTADEAEAAIARDRLEMFDRVQRGEEEVSQLRKLGAGGLAGGLTDAQARAGIRKIEAAGYLPDEFAVFRSHIKDAVSGLVEERISSGTLTREEADAWAAHGFTEYVPLYVNHERTDAGNDVYLGTSNFNPAGDYTREGSVTRASHALITVQQMLFRTASGIEAAPFKEQLHAMYTEHRPAGLSRINVNDARLNRFSPAFSQELHDKKGFLYSDTAPDGSKVKYKYYFDDDAISEGIFAHHAEPDWKVMKAIGGATATFARVLTKYNPLFPVKTWARDAVERTLTLTSRRITAQDGSVLPAASTFAKLLGGSFNPVHVLRLGNYLMLGGSYDSPTVKAYLEMKEQGGVSTYQQALTKSVMSMRGTLRSMSGLRKHTKSLDAFFTHWNEAWSAAPAVGAYLALKDSGVDSKQAAFRSLDVMNAGNKGEWSNTLGMFYPFIGPAFEGGRNFIRNLSTKRGRAVFAASTLAGVALYATLHALGESLSDGDGANPMDDYSLEDLGNFIPLVISRDNVIKIPVPFGNSRIAWMMGAAMHRFNRNIDTPGKIAGSLALTTLKELQPIELQSNVMADNFLAGVALSATPSVLSPLMEVAMNTNHFGGMLHSKAAREANASDSALASTPQAWTDIAKALRKATGGHVDAYPESIRHLASAWFVGPLRGIITGLEEQSLYTTGGKLSARQELGPVWDAVGVSQFWDNGSRNVSRTYWKYQDAADDVLRKYGQLRTKEGTQPGQAGNAAYSRVIAAGGSVDEARLVRAAIIAEKERSKRNRELKAKVNDYKRRDLNLETLTPAYTIHSDAQERTMRAFISEARRNQ